jgi:ferredoxin
VEVSGKDCVESATIAQLNDKWEIVPGTMRKYDVDAVLVAVGLEPVDDFYKEAKEQGLKVWVAGDAEEVAEASSAMISGTIRGIEIASSLGADVGPIPLTWRKREEIFKARPGPLQVHENPKLVGHEIVPVFHCFQEIPCNACVSACELSNLIIEDDGIVGAPSFSPEGECDGCSRCEATCPGLAVTIVDYREDEEYPTVSIPFEFFPEMASEGTVMTLTDRLGKIVGKYPVKTILRRGNKTYLVKFQVPDKISRIVAGIRIQEDAGFAAPEIVADKEILTDDAIVCRCERVTAGEIRRAIRSGIRDFNELKHVTRAGMGACGSKTCHGTILRMFREEGVKLEVERSIRPMFVEVPLRAFVEGLKNDE